MQRKVIQLNTTIDSNAHNGHRLFALCDDGTMWTYEYMGRGTKERIEEAFEWASIDDIPQGIREERNGTPTY